MGMIRSLVKSLFTVGLAVSLAFSSVSAQELTAKDTSEVRFLNGRKFYMYEVKKGETLYSISRKFGIPQDELTDLNPVIRSGIKPKQDLWIPAYSWKGLPRETGAEAVPRAESREKETRRSLHIALISDLDLGKVYTGTPEPGDSAVEERIDRSTRNNLEFTEGAMLALKRFQRSNPEQKLRVSLVDSEGDTASLSKSAGKSDFRKADVWITNESGPVLSYLNRQSEKHGALLVSCGVNTSDRIMDNRDAVSLFPSSLLQCRKMGALTANRFKNAVAVFVKTSNPKEAERMNAMKEGWLSVHPPSSVRLVDYSKGFGKAVVDSLKGSKHHVVFVPSSNEDMITGLLLALKEKKATCDFSVVGLPTWYAFETIDPQLMQACDVYYFNAGSTDMRPDLAVEFRQSFRDEYNTEPGESAYIGYDAAKLMMESRKRAGADVFRKDVPPLHEGLYSDYRFKRVEKEGSCENQHITVWGFQEVIPKQVEF